MDTFCHILYILPAIINKEKTTYAKQSLSSYCGCFITSSNARIVLLYCIDVQLKNNICRLNQGNYSLYIPLRIGQPFYPHESQGT